MEMAAWLGADLFENRPQQPYLLGKNLQEEPVMENRQRAETPWEGLHPNLRSLTMMYYLARCGRERINCPPVTAALSLCRHSWRKGFWILR